MVQVPSVAPLVALILALLDIRMLLRSDAVGVLQVEVLEGCSKTSKE